MNKNLKLNIAENFLKIKYKAKKILVMFISFFIFLNALNAPTYARSISKGLQCSPKYIAQNIQTAVFALKAAQYCTGVDLPYSAAQASMRVDELRCGVEASDLLDDLIVEYDVQYKSIMSGAGRQVVCKKAASLSF